MSRKHNVVAFDKEGKPVLPAVLVGHERLDYSSSTLSGDRFAACSEHGTAPVVYVRTAKPPMLLRCCERCVRQHCQITTAILQSEVLSLDNATENDTENPEGHSY